MHVYISPTGALPQKHIAHSPLAIPPFGRVTRVTIPNSRVSLSFGPKTLFPATVQAGASALQSSHFVLLLQPFSVNGIGTCYRSHAAAI